MPDYYVRRTPVVTAEQFLPDVKPWPEGVEIDAGVPAHNPDNPTYRWNNEPWDGTAIFPGDWIVTGMFVGQYGPDYDEGQRVVRSRDFDKMYTQEGDS